jgi:hypothetical protein
MATIQEIKKQMTDEFIANPKVVEMYGLNTSKSFEEQFSVASIESILFFVAATAMWSMQSIFSLFRADVSAALAADKAHRASWYKTKTLAFQEDTLLPADSDVYQVIEPENQVVKYCSAVDAQDSSKLMIKIAGEQGGLRQPLTNEITAQVTAYLNAVKDAGVRIQLINLAPDYFKAEIDVYYDATLYADRVSDAVKAGVREYIENLPFNGEYSNVGLIDRLQQVEGVIIPELKYSESHPALAGYDFAPINAKKTPEAGYFRVYDDADLTINMIAYKQ